MARGSKKYPIPKHLLKIGISQDDFGNWLDNVTLSHVRRDRKRFKVKISGEVYRKAIHKAVLDDSDKDYYTSEPLNWHLIRYFSKDYTTIPIEKHKYFPTIDHENLSATEPIFHICSLRTNICKSNYTITEVTGFCRAFINGLNRAK
jgi:hypothetical protein